MIATLQQILDGALDRLAYTITTYLPPLLAGLTIFLATWILARLLRWLLTRVIKAPGFDRFLRQSGFSAMLGRSGQLRAARLVAGAAYWSILIVGLLTGLSAFNTNLTSRMIEGAVFLFPKLVAAAAILLAGVWVGQYLGRGTLVWACNEGWPFPRRLATGVRVLILFVAVVVAADCLDFARSVFLAAFLLLVGGAVVALSIPLGLAVHQAFRQHFQDEPAERHAESLWNHL